MSSFATHLKARPRLYIAAAAGLLSMLLLPGKLPATTTALVGWNVAVWLYLLLIGVMMLRADHGVVQRTAVAQSQGAAVVLAMVGAASIASVAAIVLELATAKAVHGGVAWQHLLFALVTVVGAWLLLPILFSLNYASVYYRAKPPGGLAFPGADASFHPDYTDFLYFSFTIAVASQTADIAITTRPLRQLALVQALLSFAFNAAILALTINIAASLF
jgi:uncharacterized membrane protein